MEKSSRNLSDGIAKKPLFLGDEGFRGRLALLVSAFEEVPRPGIALPKEGFMEIGAIQLFSREPSSSNRSGSCASTQRRQGARKMTSAHPSTN